MALGASLRSGVEQALSPASESDEQSYRVDETYIKVKGQEKYLYRAVDSTGRTIDFLLTAKRDAAMRSGSFERHFALPVIRYRGSSIIDDRGGEA